MKGFSMNKVLGTIKKRPTFGGGVRAETAVDPENDTPEAIATRCVKQFCQSVGSASGDDVIFLPSIVESAVASPAAAAECARLIRKFMNQNSYSTPACQYNAIMLIRILSDNPGPTFTRNMDKKFVDTAKELLRTGRDASVRQILMETLDAFENTKAHDEGLALIIGMWKKEKEKAYRAYGRTISAPVSQTVGAAHFGSQQAPELYPRSYRSKQLPDPVELANRLEEARSSAKLLEQVVACTPSSEVLSNDLIKEFAQRCTSASRSIQGYMAAEDPAPDNDTMESLIDTNEQLQQALNHHRRAVLQAKKQLGLGDSRSATPSPAPPLSPSQQQQRGALDSRPLPPVPVRNAASASGGKGKANLDAYGAAAAAGSSRSAAAAGGLSPTNNNNDNDDDDDDDEQNPFRDPPPPASSTSSSSRRVGGGSAVVSVPGGPPRLSYEPFHPGFMGSSSSAAAGATTERGRGR
ncbi:hypothetical protein VTK56DRAFT_1930 [Thermocarpiscus australiensis]